MTDTDLGRALLRAFGPHQALPYVPDWAIDDLAVSAPATFSTFALDPQEAYLFGPISELLDPPCVRRFAITFWGHGIASYAWTVRLERPGLRVLAQCAPEPADVQALFAQVRRLDARVPETDEHDVVVLLSDFRGVRSVGFAQPGADPRKWEDLHVVDDIDTALEELLDPRDPWDDLEQVFAHALRQALHGGTSMVLIEDERFLVPADAEKGKVVVTLVPDETYELQLDLRHIDRALHRLGWRDTPEMPNLHLTITSEDTVVEAAAALASTAYFVWQLDPVATAERLAEVAGSDEGDLDCD